MLDGRAQALLPEEWWTELGMGPSHRQSSVWPVVSREDLLDGGREVLVLEEDSLTRERELRVGEDDGVGSVAGAG